MNSVDPQQLQEEIKDLRTEIKDLRTESKDLHTEVRALMRLVSESHQKMNQHVDFVENVYTSVRHPLNFVKRRIESWTGHGASSAALPQLEFHVESDQMVRSEQQHDSTS